MTDTTEAIEARRELMLKWADHFQDLVQQMIDQVRAQGLDPAWFYPRTVVIGPTSARIHWGLRPEVETALQAMTKGISPDEAARIGSLAGSKSIEDLITDDTQWVGVDGPS